MPDYAKTPNLSWLLLSNYKMTVTLVFYSFLKNVHELHKIVYKNQSLVGTYKLFKK